MLENKIIFLAYDLRVPSSLWRDMEIVFNDFY